MRTAYIVVLIVAVLVIASVSFVAFWASVMISPLQPASEATPPSTSTPEILIPTPVVPSIPVPSVSIPTISPTPSPTTAPTIAIKHEGVTYKTLVDQYGIANTPDAGYVWLVINMTITNKGYDSFNTNPLYFSVTVNNVKYEYDSVTYSYGNWNTVDILNGGSFTGSLVFQVPSSATSYILDYERFGKTYNLVPA